MMRIAPITDNAIIKLWKFIEQRPQRASLSGQRVWGGKIFLAGYVKQLLVLMHHRQDTFAKHSSQLVAFLRSQLGGGAVVGAGAVVFAGGKVFAGGSVVFAGGKVLATGVGCAWVALVTLFCASVELKPKTSSKKQINPIFPSSK